MNNGLLLIISGPSGSGKGTVVRMLREDSDIAVSVSMTTREKRMGEEDGISYFYTTEENFKNMVANDEFLEHATFAGHYYGTPRSYVEKKIAEGKTVILEIEVKGALQVKENYPDSILIFLIPPTISELRQRLLLRNTETGEAICERLKIASEEIKFIEQYDYLVVNDKVCRAVGDILKIAHCEKLRPRLSSHVLEAFNKETSDK